MEEIVDLGPPEVVLEIESGLWSVEISCGREESLCCLTLLMLCNCAQRRTSLDCWFGPLCDV